MRAHDPAAMITLRVGAI